ncbi:hypothetical protein BVY01_00220 [bacterium I07]|nr:hypothetical protein BVY01_00220 [bacterium I07]
MKRAQSGKLAALGGKPVRSIISWPKWPHRDQNVIDSILETTKSGIWCMIQSKTGTVPTFEKKWAAMNGVHHCVATGSGTQALHTVVEALDIGPGDEVITSPYRAEKLDPPLNLYLEIDIFPVIIKFIDI